MVDERCLVNEHNILKKCLKNHFHIVVELIKRNTRDFQNLPHGDPNSEMNK